MSSICSRVHCHGPARGQGAEFPLRAVGGLEQAQKRVGDHCNELRRVGKQRLARGRFLCAEQWGSQGERKYGKRGTWTPPTPFSRAVHVMKGWGRVRAVSPGASSPPLRMEDPTCASRR